MTTQTTSKKTTSKTQAPTLPVEVKRNREAWLFRVARAFAPAFAKAGFPLPKRFRVTCGFGIGSVSTLGECFIPVASKDETIEIFVSPTLDSVADVVGVLIHELCHAAAFARSDLAPEKAEDVWTKNDVRRGHGKVFGEIARAMELEGPLTTTVAGPGLVEKAEKVVEKIGAYPHAAMVLGGGWTRKGTGDTPAPKGTVYVTTDKPTTQRNRHLLAKCPTEGCGYQVRASRKHLERAIPFCPACYYEKDEIVPMNVDLGA